MMGSHDVSDYKHVHNATSKKTAILHYTS